jgi:hypothetical protein
MFYCSNQAFSNEDNTRGVIQLFYLKFVKVSTYLCSIFHKPRGYVSWLCRREESANTQCHNSAVDQKVYNKVRYEILRNPDENWCGS